MTAAPAPTDGFSALLDHLTDLLNKRDLAALSAGVIGATPAGREFRKALRDLDRVYYASAVKPIIIRKDALAKRPRYGDVMAKAHRALERTDLTPEQRGRLMLAVSDLNDGAFAKAHPMVDQIDDVRAKLDAALASGHAGNAGPLIKEALKLIASGTLDPAAHARLSLLLGEIRTKIEEKTDAKDR